MGFISSMRKRARKRAARNKEKAFISQTIEAHLPDLKVRNGPFKDMLYPQAASVGSSLFPKLLGSYESELHGILEEIISKSYTAIVDVGCAEGYYATGLGLRIPEAHLFVFDINPTAIELCKKMVALNNIESSRLTTGDILNNKTLLSLPLGERALIISDCEGYEKQLFTRETPRKLAEHDFLIEAHDVIDIHISGYLKEIFADTHDITVVGSVDDIHKAQRYKYPELEGFSLPERKALLSERRASAMEWLYCRSRSTSGPHGTNAFSRPGF